MIAIGTAGWTIPRAVAASFPGDGSHLARYSRVLSSAEINSSFHRPHRFSTYERWAAATPAGFRFAVKLPKAITHQARLRNCESLLDRFVAEVIGLGDKLGVLLVQLPPSLAFEGPVVDAFFAALRARHPGAVACEPRHASWFEVDADDALVHWRSARVAADPAKWPAAARPGGWTGGLVYHRWHGSPRTYWSSYDDAWLGARAAEIAPAIRDHDVWCLFDNTVSGAALGDALRFAASLDGGGRLDLSGDRVPRLPAP